MRPAEAAQCVVRWTFTRDHDVLTCQVHRHGSQYRLSLIPRAPKGLSGLETFATIFGALQRHAAVAAQLREEGWTVVAYSTETPTTPTYRPAEQIAA